MYETKFIIKGNKTDEISFFSKNTSTKRFLEIFSHQERKVIGLFRSQLKILCSYVFYLYIQEKIR